MPARQLARQRSAERRWGQLTLWACFVVLVATALGWPHTPRASSQSATSLLVVVHPSVKVAGLDERALQMIFLRRRLTWDDGTRILPFNYPAGHALRVFFDRVVLGFGRDETARYWIDARIRGGGEAPRSLGTPMLAARVVMQLRGSIAYLPAEEVTSGLRVVARVSATGVTAL